jgi:hypothetical protein
VHCNVILAELVQLFYTPNKFGAFQGAFFWIAMVIHTLQSHDHVGKTSIVFSALFNDFGFFGQQVAQRFALFR